MASITTHSNVRSTSASAPLKTLWAGTQRILSSIGKAILHVAETNSRVKEIERLQSLSDAQLAQYGLKREDIARHVFRDMFYV